MSTHLRAVSGGRLRPSRTIQHQDTEFRIGQKFRYADGVPAQYPLGVTRRVRPLTEPYDLRRRPYCCREFIKVGIGAHDGEVPRPGKLPDFTIWAVQQVELDYMSRFPV